MTISGALSNAMSGLRAAGAGSELVSSNISNALTKGYGRRTLSLSPDTVSGSGGVRINGIRRDVDPVLVADRRLASADFGNTQANADFLAKVENLVGDPERADSLSARLSQFEASLVSAASRPDLDVRLNASVNSAKDLARALKRISDGLQDARENADRSIDMQVNRLNEALDQVQQLNTRIIMASRGREAENVALQDQRQLLVDEISAMVPVREVPRDNGAIALFSIGGAILVDGPAAVVEFSPTRVVVPEMTQQAGVLSGLTINGIQVPTGSENGVLRGGTLGAQFTIRDELAVGAQSRIDAFARDLVERFQDPAADPTLISGQAGLFTDGGLPFDASDEVGLSGRIALNELVDPEAGGSTWRLRAGLGAAQPGEPGDAANLSLLRETLMMQRRPASGGFGPYEYSSFKLSSDLLSGIAADRFDAERSQTFAATNLETLTQAELEQGVDTDTELQNLMVLEQAYAANARVIAAVDEMMQSILRL